MRRPWRVHGCNSKWPLDEDVDRSACGSWARSSVNSFLVSVDSFLVLGSVLASVVDLVFDSAGSVLGSTTGLVLGLDSRLKSGNTIRGNESQKTFGLVLMFLSRCWASLRLANCI